MSVRSKKKIRVYDHLELIVSVFVYLTNISNLSWSWIVCE